MKKVFIIILMFIFILNVNAETDCNKLMSITQRCYGPEEVLRDFSPGEIVICEISFKSNEDVICTPNIETIKDISFNINTDGLSKSDEKLGAGFSKLEEDNLYQFTRSTGISEGLIYRYSLLLPNVTVDTSYNISYSNVVIKNNENIEINKNVLGTNIGLKVLRPKSTVNTLSSLNISNYNLIPLFSSNVTDYKLTLDTTKSKVTITPTVTDTSSTLSGDIGEKSLNFGENTFKIYVKSESGVTKTYTVVITRQDFRSDENGLKSLTVSNTFINFDPSNLRYDVEVDKEISTININSSLIDPKSVYVEGFGNGSKTLNIGTNTFYVKVKAENETIKTYTIVVVRNDGKSSVNSLRTLQVVGFEKEIKFIPETLEYSFKVSSLTKEIEIKSNMTSEKSVYLEGFGNRKVSLNPGLNKIYIKVRSEKGIVKTYTLNITREDPKDNTNLKSLIIDIEDFKFDPNILEYNLEISNLVNKLDIEATSEEENSKVVISGNNDLIVGKNTVKIEITSESGKKKEYIVYVNKRDKASTISKLKNIIIENYDLKFDSNIYEYSIKINDEDRLNITVEKLDILTKYTVLGNNNLKYGSTIKIISSAEDGSHTEYKIKITKDIGFLLPLVGTSILVLIISITASMKKRNVKIIKKEPMKKRRFIPVKEKEIEPKIITQIPIEKTKSIPEIEDIPKTVEKEEDILDI